MDANSKSLKLINHFQWLGSVAKKLFVKIKNEKDTIDPEKLVCVKTDGKTIFNFNKFKISLDLASDIYKKKIYLKMQKMNKLK